MALLNFLFPNSYTRIEALHYVKGAYSLSFDISIRQNKDDIMFLAQKTFTLFGTMDVPSIILTDMLESDFDVDTTSWYYLPEGHLEHPLHLCRRNTVTNSWDYWFARDWAQPFYVDATDSYVAIRNGVLVPTECINDKRQWDRYFSSSLIDNVGSNYIKQAYLFLKAQPGFSNCIDA